MKEKYDIYDYTDNATTIEKMLCAIANELAESNKKPKKAK